MLPIMAACKKNRGLVWGDEETSFLIECWGAEVTQMQLEKCKTSKETSKVSETILIQLKKKGFCESFKSRDVVNKIKKLRGKYKQEKDKKRKSGANRWKEWKFFYKLDVFLNAKPNVEPLLVLDTMAEGHDIKPETEEKGDAVIEAGVISSGSGCIRVYAEDDEILCPNCGKPADVNGENTVGLDEAFKTDDGPPQPPCKSDSVIKKRKRSNVEKSLDAVFQKMQESTKDDFLRLQKWEEEKMKKEHEFHMEQVALENQRRREEREHEMDMLRMMLQVPQQQQQHHLPNPHYPTVSVPLSLATNGISTTSNSYTSDITDIPDDSGAGYKRYVSL